MKAVNSGAHGTKTESGMREELAATVYLLSELEVSERNYSEKYIQKGTTHLNNLMIGRQKNRDDPNNCTQNYYVQE